MESSVRLPLEGIRVIDSAHQYPGPFCSMILGDLGAEVIKVERPDGGDPARRMPGFFSSINRNKKSITLDLKHPEGRRIMLELLRGADVFTEGFRPGVAARLGLDYGAVSMLNPRIVYCSISGYGQDGPYRDMPGHDINYQALSGMLQCFRDERGDHIQPSLAIADLSSGMFAAMGILAALMARDGTGRGQHLDVSMFGALMSLMSTHFGIYWHTGRTSREYDAGYGIFEAGDGRPFTLGIAHEDWFWKRLCDALGLDDIRGLGTLERRARRGELRGRLQQVFRERPLDHWIQTLRKADVPVAPVKAIQEVLEDPQVSARGIIQEVYTTEGKALKQVAFPVRFSLTPAQMRLPPPGLGEHTDEVLQGMGYTPEEIGRLRAEGVI